MEDTTLHRRIAELSSEQRILFLQRLQLLKKEVKTVAIDEEQVRTGDLPFSSGQCWLIEESTGEHPSYWNMVFFLEPLMPLNPALLERTIAYLMQYHDVLRTRLQQRGGEWSQTILKQAQPPFTQISLKEVPVEQQQATIEALVQEHERRINSYATALFSVAYIDLGHSARLVWIINHFLTDGFSNQILFQDFQTVYQQLSQGQEPALPARTTAFKEITQQILAYIRSATGQQELQHYWLRRPWQKLKPIPLDHPEGVTIDPESSIRAYGTFASNEEVEICLSAATTQTLLSLNQQATILELLITALVQVGTAWTETTAFYLYVQDLGRQTLFKEVDLTRTVGFLAHARHLIIDTGHQKSFAEILPLVQQQLEEAPNKGRTLDWLKRPGDRSPVPAELRALPHADLTFNYMGFLDQLTDEQSFFRPLPIQALTYPLAIRNHALECKGYILDGRLTLRWIYSRSIHHQQTIEWLGRKVQTALETYCNQQ
ncbi:condensation domain-containing protein [Tengunoibacter tsumagoiensis]|uniref:Condensation domain-containing protein n=1 Tax=Tengunoibacter tsumagoiensis TaxID=2014871 RepID=A0A402A5T9_9CHLR|nr:condensation domain-containing protein [Tengunoibacter tsumagoiensis]GCE14513.1 hypothetical protein KTT_43720 [Tengunoibacter tsumagoiensis]